MFRFFSIEIDAIVPGAVELDAAESDEPIVEAVLQYTRQRLKEGGESTKDYYITIIDMKQEQEEDNDNDDDDGSNSNPPNTSSIPSSPSSCIGTCFVVRLWPLSVFLGARESAKGDPGEGCRDWHYNRTNGAFVHEMKIEDTDRMMEEQ